MYQTRIGDFNYKIFGYVTDDDGEYNDATDLVVLLGIYLAHGEENLLYYHPGSIPSDWKAKARLVYRALRLLTSRTLPGRIINTIRLYYRIDVIEELFFGQNHPYEGYYKFGEARNCIFRGRFYGRYIVRTNE